MKIFPSMNMPIQATSNALGKEIEMSPTSAERHRVNAKVIIKYKTIRVIITHTNKISCLLFSVNRTSSFIIKNENRSLFPSLCWSKIFSISLRAVLSRIFGEGSWRWSQEKLSHWPEIFSRIVNPHHWMCKDEHWSRDILHGRRVSLPQRHRSIWKENIFWRPSLPLIPTDIPITKWSLMAFKCPYV